MRAHGFTSAEIGNTRLMPFTVTACADICITDIFFIE
jgi:hypothetical protein